MHEALKYLVKSGKVSEAFLATYLFPDMKHPGMSLKRLMDGKSAFTLEHLLKIKKLVNISLDSLILDADWVVSYVNELWTFENLQYFCTISNKKMVIQIYKKGKKKAFLFQTHILEKSITLNEVFQILNTYTNEH